jgi:hypothetical protein
MIRLIVNDRAHTVGADPDTPLLWVLRDALGLKGTKYGCGVGRCPCAGATQSHGSLVSPGKVLPAGWLDYGNKIAASGRTERNHEWHLVNACDG